MINSVQGGAVPKRSCVMKNLMNKEGREVEKKTVTSGKKLKINDYKKLISDDHYLEHAIGKIATDLSHYLTK